MQVYTVCSASRLLTVLLIDIFFFLRNCHLLFCLCKTEEMTCSKDASVNNCNKQISVLRTLASQLSNQRYCNNVDNPDCNHSRNRTRSINLCTFIDILCHCSTKGAIRDIYTSISKYQQTVCNYHIDNLCRI